MICTYNLSEHELLNYAIENGMIRIDAIRDKIAMEERNKYLEKHPYSIWLNNEGKWQTYLPDSNCKSGRKPVRRKNEQDLYDAIIDYYKSLEVQVFVKDVFYDWINEKLNDFGEITKQTYDRYETDFFRFFEKSSIYDIEFRFITEELLENFIKTTIKNQKLTSKSWGNLRTLIKGIFRYAKKRGHTNISIYQFLGDLELSPKIFNKVIKLPEEEVFTQSEVDKIMDYINTHELSMVSIGIVLAFQTGLRAGEIAGLKYSDLSGNMLNVRRTEIRYKDSDGKYVFEVRDSTKGEDGYRRIILTKAAIKTIKQANKLNPFGEYLFMRDGYRIKGKSYTNKIYRICKWLGIKERSIHKARKTYGTKLLNAGIDDKLIEMQMGHTDIKTTKGYYWYNNRENVEIKNILENALAL